LIVFDEVLIAFVQLSPLPRLGPQADLPRGLLLSAGETKTVNLTLSVPEMALWNVKKEWLVEPGAFFLS